MRSTGVSMLLFMVVINVMLYFTQLGIQDANPDSNVQIFNFDKSIMKNYETENGTIKQFDQAELPSGTASIDEASNYFSDIFGIIRKWIIGPLSIFKDLVMAVPNMMQLFGWPLNIVFAFSFIWYMMAVAALFMIVKGE